MEALVGAAILTCELTGERTHGRAVGYCTTPAGTVINRAIIAQNAALACPRYDNLRRGRAWTECGFADA